jgi:hypothetical protein
MHAASFPRSKDGGVFLESPESVAKVVVPDIVAGKVRPRDEDTSRLFAQLGAESSDLRARDSLYCTAVHVPAHR